MKTLGCVLIASLCLAFVGCSLPEQATITIYKITLNSNQEYIADISYTIPQSKLTSDDVWQLQVEYETMVWWYYMKLADKAVEQVPQFSGVVFIGRAEDLYAPSTPVTFVLTLKQEHGSDQSNSAIYIM